MKLFLFLFLFVSSHVYSSTDIKTAISKLTDKSDAQIIEVAKKAFVMIDSYNPRTGHVSSGSAFFINPDGYLITNYHIVENFLSEDKKFVFTLYDGSHVDGSFEIVRCSDNRKIDLCILKLNVKNEYYFNIVPIEEKLGTKVFILGNKSWLPVALLDTGSVIDVYDDLHQTIHINKYDKNYGVRIVELKAPLFTYGYSGGPIFDSQGDLIAVSTLLVMLKEKYRKLPEAKVGVSNKEVYTYMTSKTISGAKYAGKKCETDKDLFKLDFLKKMCSAGADPCINGINAVCADKTRQEDCTKIKAFYAAITNKTKR